MPLLFLLTAALAFAADPSVCRRAKTAFFPAGDEPSAAQKKELLGCRSEDLYYRAKNFEKARRCAFVEKAKGDAEVFGGTNVLLMIYANGLGVSQNIPLAEKIVCESDAAGAEIEARLEHLEAMAAGKGKKPFEICDDITSGFMMGHCAKFVADQAKAKRGDRWAEMKQSWSDSERAAFAKLEAAAATFAATRSDDEVDQSGSGRSAFVVAEQEMQERDFLESVEKLEAKKAPKYSAEEAKEENEKLTELLGKIYAGKNQVAGTIEKNGVERTQKAWEAYRAAWVAFAKVRYPGVPSESIAAWFTKKRNHMLRAFVR